MIQKLRNQNLLTCLLVIMCIGGPSIIFAQGSLSTCGVETITQTYIPPSDPNEQKVQTFTVPDGVVSITIQATGADGGNSTSARGGSGATLNGVELPVNSGEVYSIIVGEAGMSVNDGGSGAGGGGGSFVYTDLSTPILIAAGGGGASGLAGSGGLVPLTGTGSGVGGGDAYTFVLPNDKECLVGFGGGGGAGFFSNGSAGFKIINTTFGAGSGGQQPLAAIGGLGGSSLGADVNTKGGDGGFGGGAGGGALDLFDLGNDMMNLVPAGGGGGGGYQGGMGGSVVLLNGQITGEGGQAGESFISNTVQFANTSEIAGEAGTGTEQNGSVTISYKKINFAASDITINCPDDMERIAGDNCDTKLGASFTVEEPTTTCDGVVLTSSFEATDENNVVTTFATLSDLQNHSFSLGTHTIQYIATSNIDVTAMCEFMLTVNPSDACFTINFEFETDVSTDLNTQVCNCQEQCVVARIMDADDIGIPGEQLQLVISDGSLNPPELADFPAVTGTDGTARICFTNDSQISQTIQVSVKRK